MRHLNEQLMQIPIFLICDKVKSRLSLLVVGTVPSLLYCSIAQRCLQNQKLLGVDLAIWEVVWLPATQPHQLWVLPVPRLRHLGLIGGDRAWQGSLQRHGRWGKSTALVQASCPQAPHRQEEGHRLSVLKSFSSAVWGHKKSRDYGRSVTCRWGGLIDSVWKMAR